MPTALDDLIRGEIAENGPISVARYMDLCLAHPQHGYYMTRDPLGAAGDFTTAPEISQMFGEIIGAWVLQAWLDLGSPAKFTLLECGPGRGTLMSDILRIGALRPAFLQGADIVMLETSPVLQAAQSRALHAHPHRHVTRIEEALEGYTPILVIGNEFFDALPIHQYVRDGQDWRERLVGLDATGNLVFGLGVVTQLDAPNCNFYEHSPATESLFARICLTLKHRGGAGIFIDYGPTAVNDQGDTLQAVRGHQKVDVLTDCGLVDLTAHVNFGTLRRIAETCDIERVQIHSQQDFLIQNGIQARQDVLTRQNPARTAEFQGQVDRLTAPDQMGTLFQVITIGSACNFV